MKFSVLHLLIEYVYKIGCAISELIVDYKMKSNDAKYYQNKPMKQLVCYIGPLIEENEEMTYYFGEKPCSKCSRCSSHEVTVEDKKYILSSTCGNYSNKLIRKSLFYFF